MAIAAVTYSFTTATTAVAAQVNQDFTDIVTFLNSNVIHIDGSKTMTGQLALLAADPTTANQAARKSYVDQNARYKGATSVSTAIAGTIQATDTQLLVKSGVDTISTDANSVMSMVYSTPFPNSCIGAVAAMYWPSLVTGNVGISAAQVVATLVQATKTTCSFRLSTQAGNASPSTGPYPIFWYALGN